MHQEDAKARQTRPAAARKAPSAKEQEFNAMIAREAAADRCFACYGAPCRCPANRGLRAHFAARGASSRRTP